MKRLREKVRDRTGANRNGTRVERVIEDLNPILRGWGNYFRTGNAARKFGQVDDYVYRRLRRLQVKKRGRNLRAGQADQWTSDWFHDLGCTGSAAPSLSKGCVTMSGRPSVSRVRENRTHGLKGDGETGPSGSCAPDYQ